MHYAIVDFIADIAENAGESGAGNVVLKIDETGSSFEVSVTDDGKGMNERESACALDPFHTDGLKHPGRKVGLGLPFLKQAIDLSKGDFSLRSEKGRGTEVRFRFDKGNLDCPPIGDIASTLLSIICLPGDGELTITRTRKAEAAAEAAARGDLSYELRKSELKETLGDLEGASSLALLKRYLVSQEEG
ncbi:MAG: ATP-binding protein [Spirochaetes bacterium]|nr:ATP-binding protein [Spirochaetota bacterium]